MSAQASGRVPLSTGAALATLARVTLLRARRGKALWIAALIAALPIAYAAIAHAQHAWIDADDIFQRVLPIYALLPAMLVGASIGDDIEQRTTTYLWSRPLARWVVPAGKLLALAPIVAAYGVATWLIATRLGGVEATAASTAAMALGGAATSVVAAGVALVVPRYAMSLGISYLLLDLVIGWLPFSLRALSVTHQLHALTKGESAGAIWALAIAAVWAAIGGLRIRKREA